MSGEESLPLQAFALRAQQAGLRLADDELPAMHEGYEGLQRVLARLPQASDWFDEPALLFAVPGCGLC